MPEKDRIARLESDMARVARQIDRLPVRLAQTTSGGEPLSVQIAMITEVRLAGTSPHYSTTFDLTFLIPGSEPQLVLVSAILLDVANDTETAILDVYNPNSLTLAALEFSAIDVRKEGLPKVGDVVRVWTSDGEHVTPGEDAWNDDGELIGLHAVYCDVLNPTDYLRGLATWSVPTAQLLFHDEDDSEIVWVDAADFVGGAGDPGDPGLPGADGDTVTAGYAIDTPHAGTVATVDFDPTEITNFGGTWQFFMHLAGDTNPSGADSPHWTTVTDYGATVNQMWWHKSGVFKFQTTLTYVTNKNQQLINVSDSWQWLDAWTLKCTIDDSTASFFHEAIKDNATYVSGQDAIVAAATDGAAATNQKERLFVDSSAITGWSAGTIQLLGHLADGSLKWDTVAAWLNTLSGYNAPDDQSIGHDASGATEWQEDGPC